MYVVTDDGRLTPPAKVTDGGEAVAGPTIGFSYIRLFGGLGLLTHTVQRDK